MAFYLDGFIVPVPKAKLAAYKALSNKCKKIWLEYGALDYVECLADDVPYGKRTSFPRAVKIQEDEVVLFSYIKYKSRKERDRINQAVMSDPRIQAMGGPNAMPFDGKRLIFGGFKSMVTT